MSAEKEWTEKYYGQAVGMTIVGCAVHEDELGCWVRYFCERKTPTGGLELFELELSQDPEGNGPGFLFGLPNVVG